MGANHRTTRSDQAAKLVFRDECARVSAPCWICGDDIDYAAPSDDYENGDRFQRDHFFPVSTHPELQFDPGNWRASHAACNLSRGNEPPDTSLGVLSRAWLSG